MKKKYLFISGAKHWNSLLNKFTKLQKRLQLLSTNTSMYNKLVTKLQSIFSKLEKMQYQTGIKVAATSLALILSTFTANAQFAAGVQMKHTGSIYEQNRSASAFADIDGDGDDDLYVGQSDGEIEVYENTNGVYSLTGKLFANGSTIDVGADAVPTFVDIDGDGDLDLYVGTVGGNIRVYTNNNGVFTGSSFLQIGGSALDVGNKAVPEFADIDGDGDLDLYVGEVTGTIEVFTNNNGVFTANGIFGLTDAFTLQSVVGTYSAPAFADIDGDGDLDLYVGSLGFTAWFSNTNGAFTSEGHLQSNLNTDIDPGFKAKPSFRDADNDGDLDLYVNVNSSNIFLYTNNGGVFTATGKVQANDIPIDVNNYANPTFEDLDADGDLDLYVGNDNGKIKVFTNNNGTFTNAGDLQAAGTTIDVGDNASPTFADIDGDGDLDLYVGEYYGRIKIFTNNNNVFTTSLFTSGLHLQGGGAVIDFQYRAAPSFADIDNDGDLDLYAGEYYGKIEVFTNNSGVFSAGTNLQAASVDIDLNYGAAPTFADIDNDGDLDLYVGNDDGNIKVYTNTNGVFSAGVNLQAATVDIDAGDYSSPTFADVDGDGDLDLYVGNDDGYVTFYENISLSTGISKIENTEINIYPNPVQNQLFIELDKQEITEITIIDYSGRIVKTITNNTTKSIDVSNLTQGIYILKVSTENGVLTNRFIKQ